MKLFHRKSRVREICMHGSEETEEDVCYLNQFDSGSRHHPPSPLTHLHSGAASEDRFFFAPLQIFAD
jgi:hypothetical protein